jgi:hypothetical protein
MQKNKICDYHELSKLQFRISIIDIPTGMQIQKYIYSYQLYSLNQHFAFSHRGGPGSIPGQSMWDLWWTKRHWDRFFSEYFGFTLSMSFHRYSITWKN